MSAPKSPWSGHSTTSSSTTTTTTTSSSSLSASALPTVMPYKSSFNQTSKPVEIQLNLHDSDHAFDLFGTSAQVQAAKAHQVQTQVHHTQLHIVSSESPDPTEPGHGATLTAVATATATTATATAMAVTLEELQLQPSQPSTQDESSSSPNKDTTKVSSPKSSSYRWRLSSPQTSPGSSPCNADNLFGRPGITANVPESLSKKESTVRPRMSLQQFPSRSSEAGMLFPSLNGNDASQYTTATSTNEQYNSVSKMQNILSTDGSFRAGSFSGDSGGSPVSKSSGNAIDIIAVESPSHQYFTTSWDVMFSWSRFKSNVSAGVGDPVRVLVNGKELRTKMHLLEKGRCIFNTGSMTPPVDDLYEVDLYTDKPNIVRFEHFRKSSYEFRYVESRLHVWKADDSVVIADLDGTITISDVEGHIRTLRLGQYDFLHRGACDFFSKLHDVKMRILYLTARPIDWATASRHHLENAKQHTCYLPPGPLITNTAGVTGALLTEVVNKNPNVFKAQVLNEIQLTMIRAGRTSKYPVYVAGFGNRPTDVLAYQQVGIELANIFLIDPNSNLKACTVEAKVHQSYDDPTALLYLLPRLKHMVPFELVERIDLCTSHQIVLADEREQLLYAEQVARTMQDEELTRTSPSGNGSPKKTSNSNAGYHASSSSRHVNNR